MDNETIIEEEKKNRENGVMGVPTYVINDGITLTGSQSVDSLVKRLIIICGSPIFNHF